MSDTNVFLFLTRSCNLACSHCYVSAEPGLGGHMSLDVFGRILDFLSVNRIDDVRLTGGEPTVHPQFDEMLRLLSVNQITPRLITNGVRLAKMRSPQSILDKVSRCWISVYGITPQQHFKIGGNRSLPLENILEFAGREAGAGRWIGVSALLSEVSIADLNNFVELAQEYGVRYLRFLFSEPDGRAVSTQTIFGVGNHARAGASEAVEFLRGMSGAFELLSVNNPFDLDSDHGPAAPTCMLASRRMWSISPEGNVYSCCFNIYDPAHLVTNVLSDDFSSWSNEQLVNTYAPRCKALHASFWGSDVGRVGCPISAITLTE